MEEPEDGGFKQERFSDESLTTGGACRLASGSGGATSWQSWCPSVAVVSVTAFDLTLLQCVAKRLLQERTQIVTGLFLVCSKGN